MPKKEAKGEGDRKDRGKRLKGEKAKREKPKERIVYASHASPFLQYQPRAVG